MYLEINIMLLLSDVVNFYFLNSKMNKEKKENRKHLVYPYMEFFIKGVFAKKIFV